MRCRQAEQYLVHRVNETSSKLVRQIIREIAKIVKVIDDFPVAGRSREEIRAGLRSLAAAPQVVFYRLNNDRPEVVRVLDGRQDIEKIFAGNGSG